MSWRIAAASVIGASHCANGLPCQDAFAVERIGSYAVLLVADGLGSARYSDVGSRSAIAAAADALRDRLAACSQLAPQWISAQLTDVFAQAVASLQLLAREQGHALREYATTLIVVVVAPELVACAHVGDGAVVGVLDDEMLTLSPPENGEYANVVLPITAADALDRLRIGCFARPPQHVAVFTDGIQNLCLTMPAATPFHRFFEPLFAALPEVTDDAEASCEITEFLSSARIRQQTDDDLTLVLLSRCREA